MKWTSIQKITPLDSRIFKQPCQYDTQLLLAMLVIATAVLWGTLWFPINIPD